MKKAHFQMFFSLLSMRLVSKLYFHIIHFYERTYSILLHFYEWYIAQLKPFCSIDTLQISAYCLMMDCASALGIKKSNLSFLM